MSLFGDIDLANANDDPYYKEDGTYLCMITGAELKKANPKPDKPASRGLALKYTILEGEKKGLAISEWKPVPYSWNINGYPSEEDQDATTNYDAEIASNAAMSMSYLKSRLLEFGFESEQMADLDPKDFLELPQMYVTIKNKNDRENVTGVELVSGIEGSDTSDPFSS